MSTSEPSCVDPIHVLDYDDGDLPQPEYVGNDIPPDPLLKSGTFIVEPNEPQSDQNDVTGHVQSNQCVDREPEKCTSLVNGVSKSTDGVSTPATGGADSMLLGRKGQQQVVSGGVPEKPSWLPEGWRIEYKVRSSGATAGSLDRYYFEPLSGRRFRSKVEVDYFLQTGSSKKPNKKRNPDADANPQEKSGSKKKKSPPPLNFDFNNVPVKVRWILSDAVKDQWTPFVGDKIVPKSTRQDWNAAFHFSCI